MLRSAWFLARKDVQYLLMRRETLMWTFLMPIVFFFFIGMIAGGFGGRGGGTVESVALRVPENAGFLVAQVEQRLEDNGYTIERPATAEDFARYTRRLTIPAGFTDSVLAGRPCTLRFVRSGEGMGTEYDEVRVGRSVYTTLADVIVSLENDRAVTAATLTQLAAQPHPVSLGVSQAGKRKEIPVGFAQAIPGTLVMFTLLIMLTSGTVFLIVERRLGLLRRLASTPITRGSVVLGKWGGRMVLALIQIAFAMIAGAVLFKMDWGPNLPMVLLLMLAYGGFNACLALLLGTFVTTEGQAVGIGVLSANVLAALGGCWWPIEVTPQWMQSLSLFLPTGVAMDAMHKLVHFQADASSAIPHVFVLTIGTLILGWIAAKKFRFQ